LRGRRHGGRNGVGVVRVGPEGWSHKPGGTGAACFHDDGSGLRGCPRAFLVRRSEDFP
jgi:hypothetical protein